MRYDKLLSLMKEIAKRNKIEVRKFLISKDSNMDGSISENKETKQKWISIVAPNKHLAVAIFAHELGHTMTDSMRHVPLSYRLRNIVPYYQMKEEFNASKWGLRFLKGNGYKRTELLATKVWYRKMLDTYRICWDGSRT